ncbi:transmembrane protein 65-like isoform X2 [Varroa jacobsoni]|uniref:transmembrane protein 65-like isoform X2 n=1 Tax=Varroa jacobsoni TaxID=62625 RepID=UPI000BF58523|nr:transmembrane protein 65-like isoform X2 [Varroa jacobsoni]
MWMHVALRRGAGGFAGRTAPLFAYSRSAECTRSNSGFIQRRSFTARLGKGLAFAGRVACLHNSAALTSVKKLLVDDDALITRQQAKDLIYRLHQKERRILLEELERNNILNDDEARTNRPTVAQLRAICVHNALPFIGFGFLDNFIMICAGDYIDMTLGLTFGISTMAAAGLGNAISDVAGIGSAWYVERIACRIGVQVPILTAEQLNMTSTRIVSNFGRAFGVFIGCLLGMCPLLLIDKTNKDGESEVDDVKKTENGNTDRNYIHDSGSRADIDSKRSKHRDEKIVAPR